MVNKIGSIASTLAVTMVLLLMGAVSYLMISGSRSSSSLASSMVVSIFLEDSITTTQLSSVRSLLEREKEVEKFEFLSKEAAAADFKKSVGVDFEAVLDVNPIPASFDVRLRNPAAIDRLEARWVAAPGVESVSYPRKMGQELGQSLTSLRLLAFGLGGVLLVVALVIIYVTIKLSVAGSRAAIGTMKIVGAKADFIRRPFVRAGFIEGAASGVLASGLLFLLVELVRGAMPMMNVGYDLKLMLLIFSVMIVSGIFLCTVFTYVVVWREIKNIDKIK